MQLKTNSLASLLTLALGTILALGFVSQTQAQEGKKAAGTWTWTVPGRNGGADRTMTLKLKTEGDKLTGSISTPGRQGAPVNTEIKDGKVKGDEVSFSVTREFNGNTMTTKYTGKIEGDTIKGKTETERDGNTRSRDWEAKRSTESK
jgi:hypothetical protein